MGVEPSAADRAWWKIAQARGYAGPHHSWEPELDDGRRPGSPFFCKHCGLSRDAHLDVPSEFTAGYAAGQADTHKRLHMDEQERADAAYKLATEHAARLALAEKAEALLTLFTLFPATKGRTMGVQAQLAFEALEAAVKEARG